MRQCKHRRTLAIRRCQNGEVRTSPFLYGYFQQFASISVYYNDDQKVLSVALHDALEFVLASNVADYREADHSARRLLQMADYICTVERASIAFDDGTQTKTRERFFGNRRSFTQPYMKQLVRKRFA